MRLSRQARRSLDWWILSLKLEQRKSSSPLDSNYGCQSDGLGCSLDVPVDLGYVVGKGGSASNQQTGTQCSLLTFTMLDPSASGHSVRIQLDSANPVECMNLQRGTRSHVANNKTFHILSSLECYVLALSAVHLENWKADF